MAMRLRGTALVVLAVIASACAPKTAPLPTVGAPRYPTFVQPVVPAEWQGTRAATQQERAWRFLQAGDLRNAQRENAAALAAQADFFPSEATAGYIELARTDPKAALGHFDRALERHAGYVPALVGRGHALVELQRDEEAITAFTEALAADPAQVDLQRRLDVLRFRVVERAIASAREAARAQHTEQARRAYQTAIASSPDSAFLYRELGLLERLAGDRASALAHLRRAVTLDPADAGAIGQLGEVLEAEGDLDGALKAYSEALALDPTPAATARRDALVRRLEFARLPAEYRAIESATQITRAQLAALIAIRLQPWVQAMPVLDPGVITDARGSWAETWIMAVVRTGLMEPFANHTFEPETVVRRATVAPIVDRLIRRLVAADQVTRWRAAPAGFADLQPGHLAYPSAALAVASGVMTPAPDGAFQPSTPVSGAEAIGMVERLERLAKGTGIARVGR